MSTSHPNLVADFANQRECSENQIITVYNHTQKAHFTDPFFTRVLIQSSISYHQLEWPISGHFIKCSYRLVRYCLSLSSTPSKLKLLGKLFILNLHSTIFSYEFLSHFFFAVIYIYTELFKFHLLIEKQPNEASYM